MYLGGKFNRTDTKVALVVWVSAVVYSVQQFTVASQNYFHSYHDEYDDFVEGWSYIKFRRKDKSDFEWETIRFFIRTIYPAAISYSFISEVIHWVVKDIKLLKCFQILFPLLYLVYYMGYKIMLILLIQPILFYQATLFQMTPIVWACNLLCLILINIYKKINTSEEFLKSLGINHFESYLNILALCWMNLKCTSFCLGATTRVNIIDYLSYSFYFPTLFTGPYIRYQDFRRTYDIKSSKYLDARLRKLALNILRCILWMAFVDFSLHFIYVNATSFQLNLVKSLDFCSLCGYGYAMGQFFHLKYVVLYGLSTNLASFDNISTPSLPRCIGRVHLYSDMWKYFDPGLYNFLKMHIFIPSQKLGLRKYGSSFLCFFFVYIWHGVEQYILIWAALNFIGVILENGMTMLYATKLKTITFMKNVKGYNLRRLKSAFAAPLLAVSAVSNFYFFAGKEVGNIFVDAFLSAPLFNKFIVLCALYCCCEISTELRDVNAHRM